MENNLKKVDGQTVSEITYSSVYFAYSLAERSVLRNISVRIPGYALTCLVGESKSGKSTFLKLMVKLQRVKEGSIRFGKWNVNEIKDSWLRKRVGYVPQKTTLFGDTIREALRGDKGSEYEADLINVCRTVNVHSYIMSLPQVKI